MKVVLTSTLVAVSETDLAAFDGLDVEFVQVDGTDPQTLLDATRDADAVIAVAEDFSREVIESLERCRSITRFGIGVDTVDVEAATERGIWVTNVPDANYREVAVHAIALALALARRLPALNRGMRDEGWASWAASGVHRPDAQTFGLLGLGRIGRRVAEMAASIGYTVIASDPSVPDEQIRALGVEPVGFDHLLARSDILSLHVPLLESTRSIIDASALAAMKPESILINVSRGGLIDEADLAAALTGGHLLGAGIDAFAFEPLEETNPLRGLPNALLTPHAAHWSAESFAETRTKVLEEAARILRGERPRYPVNDIGVLR